MANYQSLSDYTNAQRNFIQSSDPSLWAQGPTHAASGWGMDYQPAFTEDPAVYGGAQAEVSGFSTPGSTAANSANQGRMDQLNQQWLATLTPAQQAQYSALGAARDKKITGNMELAAMAAFGGVAGLGAAGAGMLGAAAPAATGSVTAGPLTEVAAGGAATAGGAGDAGAGLGWMGGADAAGASTGTTSASFFGPGGAGTLANNAGGITAGNGNWLSSLMSSLGTGGSGGSTLGNIGSLVNTIGSVGGALYNSNKLASLGKGTPAQQTANSQLNTLLQNPSSITSMPGYAAGLQAVERTGAAQGYLGSGNMMVGLDQYGQNFYNDTLKTLSGIGQQNAGVNAEYTIGGMQLFGQGMNSLGGYLAKFGGSLPDLFSSLGLG